MIPPRLWRWIVLVSLVITVLWYAGFLRDWLF